MRDSGLQRSVRARRFFREPGDAPNLGRVARVRGTGLPRGERRIRKRGSRGRRSKGAQRKSVVLAWSLLILGGTFLLLGFFTLSWLRSQMRAKQVVQHVAEEKKAKIESKFPSPSQEEAVSLVKNALAARDPVNVLAYFRTGNSEIPEIIQFLAALPSKMGEIQNIQWLSSLDANDLLLEGLMIISELDGERLNRLVLLTPDEEGTWKVDYESFARKVDPSWDQLISGEANSGLVRVIFAQDNYFNGPFSDDQKWSCFAMASPDIEPILMGYTRIGSPQDTALRRLLLRRSRKQAGVQRVTLQIKRPADSVDRQFQITRVLAEDWVLTDQAFDRSKD